MRLKILHLKVLIKAFIQLHNVKARKDYFAENFLIDEQELILLGETFDTQEVVESIELGNFRRVLTLIR